MIKAKELTLKEKVQMWINECDVDGRGIVFEFFDTDARDLINLISSHKLYPQQEKKK